MPASARDRTRQGQPAQGLDDARAQLYLDEAESLLLDHMIPAMNQEAGGDLYLNMGPRQIYRYNPGDGPADWNDERDESFIVEQIEGDGTSGTILVTAFGDPETHRRVRRLGASILDKPFEIEELDAQTMRLTPASRAAGRPTTHRR